MTDPIPPLPEDLLPFLDAEREPASLPNAVSKRIFQRLTTTILDLDPASSEGLDSTKSEIAAPSAQPPAPVPSPTRGRGSFTSATGLSTLVGSVATALVVGGFIGASIQDRITSEKIIVVPMPLVPIVVQPPPPPTATATLPTPQPTATTTETTATSAEPIAEGYEERTTPPSAKRAEAKVSKPPKSTLGVERALLDRARMALLHGDVHSSLEALNEHEQKYPEGRLSEEREFLRIRVFQQLGEVERARILTEAFARRFPRSPLFPGLDVSRDGVDQGHDATDSPLER